MGFLEYKPNQNLFHYCSEEAFHSIINSKNIWSSDLLSCNDPREIKFGYEMFSKELERILQEGLKNAQKAFLRKLMEKIDLYLKISEVYCTCFSLSGDELPMWKAYGADYSGIAIGFRPTAMLSIPGRLQKVDYSDEHTPNRFRRLIQNLADRSGKAGFPKHLMDEIEMVVAAYAAMTSLKHSSWAYEREVRTIFS